MSRRFVVLDRDGTLIIDKDYLSNPKEVEFIPGAAAALRRFQEMGLGIVVITNQSGIARGFFSLEQLQRVHEHLNSLLNQEGVKLDGMYFCPHLPKDDCNCRKPGTGLIRQAAQDLGFNPEEAFILGDKNSDIELGKRIGAVAILLRTGYGEKTEQEKRIAPDYVCDNLEQAADLIFSLLNKTSSTHKAH